MIRRVDFRKEPAGKKPFEQVYEENFSQIYNYVYAQVLHRERAEDLVSETFIKAMTHYESFDPEKASARTWLTRIARNTIIDEFRKTGGKGTVSLDAEETYVEPSSEDEYEMFQEDTEGIVYQILQRVSLEERELLSMIYFEIMKNEEIGAVLGISAKAVSARHHRLLERCKAFKDLLLDD